MKKTLLLGTAFALLLTVSATLSFAAEAKSTAYTNSRYGFSLTLPPGHLSIVEPENGDGVTVTYPNDMVLKAYGSMAPLALSTDCKSMFEEAKGEFSEVTYARLNEKQNWFAVSGYRGENIGYTKQFIGKTSSYAVKMLYPRENVKMFNAFVRAVVDSFTPGDME